MLRTLLPLLLLTLAGVALALISPLQAVFEPLSPLPIAARWEWAVRCFAAPLVLLLLGFTKYRLVKAAQLIWALWVGALSLILLWRSQGVSASFGAYGYAFVGFILVLCLSLVVSLVANLTPKPEKPEPAKPT